MKFTVNLMRSAAAGLAMVLLASCGGGEQIESFVPQRVVAFGDEASLINIDGTKYTVNGATFDTAEPPVGTPDCTANQVWVQQLAYSFGLAFEDRCEATIANANGVMRAGFGAKAADLNGQIDTFLQTRSFANNDLVTVMVGVNDIIDAAANSSDATAAVELAGTQVGDAVVRITNLGAKVIVSTVPNVGLTPYAINLETTTPGSIARLSDLSVRLNTRLRLKLQDVRDGGRAVGLILADEMVLSMVRFPSSYGLNNVTQPACAVASLLACTVSDTTTLVPEARATYASDWLWADATHLGANAQSRLGSLANSRARSNPF